MHIRSKQQFVELYIAGVLGNRFDVWLNPYDAFKSCQPLVGFREIGNAGGGKFEIIERKLIEQTALNWTKEGRKFYINGADSDDAKRTIQGEIQYRYGWEGYVGPCNGLRMRDAMKAGLMKHSSGLTTKILMNQYMDINTINDIESLLELYPESVIEFTSYTNYVGILPARNTIIWEVRDY